MIMASIEISFVSVFAHDGGKKGDNLYRLAEAHVITEKASKAFEVQVTVDGNRKMNMAKKH
jgi:hypothetical protein